VNEKYFLLRTQNTNRKKLFNEPNSCYLRFLTNWEELFFQPAPWTSSSSLTCSSRNFVLWQIPSSWSSITSRRQQTARAILTRRCCKGKNTQQHYKSSSETLLVLDDTFIISTVLSKVDDFATFKKVEVHAKNSTF